MELARRRSLGSSDGTTLTVGFDPDEWGTVADWVAAIGSAGALLAAVKLIKDEARSRRDDNEDRIWGQARSVALSASGRRRAAGDEDRPGPWNQSAKAVLSNSSGQPIRIFKWDLLIGSKLVAEWRNDPVLIPGASIDLTGVLKNTQAPIYGATSDLVFVDALAHVWELNGDGRLRRYDPSGDQT